MDDIFNMFFGGAGRAAGRRADNGPRQGADLRMDTQITFEEAAFGTEKKVTVNREEECETCHGSGAAPGSTPETCPDCMVQGDPGYPEFSLWPGGQCPELSQMPWDRQDRHPSLQGLSCKGRVKKRRVLTVKIPAGVDNGSRLRVAGEGEAGIRGGRPGDLYVYLYVKPHKFFGREGTTVTCEVPINIVQATLGAEIEVPTCMAR